MPARGEKRGSRAGFRGRARGRTGAMSVTAPPIAAPSRAATAPPPLAGMRSTSGTATADEILDRFVAWVTSTGLSLYPAQEEALLSLLDGKHVVLATPTGSGKSLVATFLHFQAMAQGKRSV